MKIHGYWLWEPLRGYISEPSILYCNHPLFIYLSIYLLFQFRISWFIYYSGIKVYMFHCLPDPHPTLWPTFVLLQPPPMTKPTPSTPSHTPSLCSLIPFSHPNTSCHDFPHSRPHSIIPHSPVSFPTPDHTPYHIYRPPPTIHTPLQTPHRPCLPFP
jgi:hypothetical protein